MSFKITWVDFHREPQSESNPEYPNGMHIAAHTYGPVCHVDLPYPFARCGLALVKCETCGRTAAITTAGRPDDARSIELPCKKH